MASSFQGWGSSWAQTWERISNPNAMYGSVTIRITTTGTLTAANNGFISGSASISFGATGVLSYTGQPETPPQSGGTVRRGTAWLKSKRRNALPEIDTQTYNLTHLHQADQEATELILALVTQGFFDGNR